MRLERHRLVMATAGLAALLALGVALLVSPTRGRAQANERLKAIHTVVLDPGHGGNNDGARGHAGSREKDLTLAVAYAARDQLQKDFPGLKVILTRNLDVDLSLPERIHAAHLAGADLFMSLHMNSSTNTEAQGVEVFYLSTDKSMPQVTDGEGTWGQHFEHPDEGVEPEAVRQGPAFDGVAPILQDLTRGRAHRDSAVMARMLLEELRRICPRCRNRGVRQENFGILRGNTIPSVVVEFGFLSHPAEEKRLVDRDTHERMGRAISRTVQRMDLWFIELGYVAATGQR